MSEKNLKIRILEKVLRFMARSVLWRHKPFVIAITGSVGKTTTRDMIVHILKEHKKIYYTKENYNNEMGVPLTILGVDKSINSVGAICVVCYKWISQMFFVKYPEIVIVEMGVDRVGDMDYLMSIVRPNISVLTSVAYAHSEFFDDIEQIAKEKQKIISYMKEGGTAIINYDDKYVRSAMKSTKKRIITYGTSEKADFIATDIDICFHQCHATGLSFKLNYKGKIIPVRLNNIIAKHFIYATLAGLVVADVVDINIVDVVGSIANFEGSPGRMRLLEGRNASTVIDDTYNASPSAMKAALETLDDAPGSRKIVALGDMRELGKVSEDEHKSIAKQLQRMNIDQIFLVGKEMKVVYKILNDTKMTVKHYDNVDEVGDDVRDSVHSGDIVLVKGSRGIKMEKIVATLVEDKTKTLCVK
jgi:UDP-N-acetylmuramoyl-tripeptide--D-alanyl-D-alanine ligase